MHIEFRNDELKLSFVLEDNENMSALWRDFSEKINGKAEPVSLSSFRRMINDFKFVKGWTFSYVNQKQANLNQSRRTVSKKQERREKAKGKKASKIDVDLTQSTPFRKSTQSLVALSVKHLLRNQP